MFFVQINFKLSEKNKSLFFLVHNSFPINMNDVEKEFCLNFTQKLIDCELSIAFVNPVDKNADYAPDYFRIIEHPMDLSTVKNKIIEK